MPTVLEKVITKSTFISALRSGQYEQLTDGRMFDGPKVCAMMVAHKLVGDDKLNHDMSNDVVLGVIPSRVYDRISELNDSGMTFSEIADILDQHLSNNFSSLNY